MAPIGILIVVILVVVPLWMILPRAGLTPIWALVAALPFGLIILLWILALKRWPSDPIGGGRI